jgi:hypothetical protein
VAISYVGGATGITSVTMPAHQAGDLLLAFAYRDGSNLAPSLPAGWSSPDAIGNGVTNTGNTQGARIGFKFATSSSETSGTWTNATGLIIHVYRGVSQRSPIQIIDWVNAASSLAMTYGPLDVLIRNDGTSWVVAFAGHRSQNAAVNTAPSGLTNRTDYSDATNHVAGHDTNGGVTTAATYSNTVSGTANGYITCVLDLIEDYSADATNICTNGTLDTNDSGWTYSGTGWGRQTDQASPCMGSTAAGAYAVWATGVSLGTIYEVSWTSFVDVGQVNLVTSNFGGMNNPSPTATGRTIRRLIRLNGGTANIQFQGGSGYRIDNIEIRTIGPASTTHDGAMTDAATAAESITGNRIQAAALTDAAATGETLTAIAIRTVTLTDAAISAELITGDWIPAGQSMTDAAVSGESITAIVIRGGSLTDAATVSEVINAIAILQGELLDAAVSGEDMQGGGGYLLGEILDALTTSESIEATAIQLATMTDGAVSAELITEGDGWTLVATVDPTWLPAPDLSDDWTEVSVTPSIWN